MVRDTRIGLGQVVGYRGVMRKGHRCPTPSGIKMHLFGGQPQAALGDKCQ